MINSNGRSIFYKMNLDRTCIIILNWNGKERTLACLQSVQSADCSIIVVDNGSTDGSIYAIREKFPDCTVIETGANLGYSAGNNRGIQHGLKRGFDYFFILNNDTTVDPNCLPSLLKQMEEEPEVGILGTMLSRMEDPENLDHLGGNWNPKTCNFEFVGYREKRRQIRLPKQLDYVCGAAVMIRREVFEKVGLFDPRFFLFWEEADLCFRARKKGFRISLCSSALVFHQVSASFTTKKTHAAYFVYRNRLLWIEKNLSGYARRFSLLKVTSHQLLTSSLALTVRGTQKQLQKLLHKKTERNEERILRAKAVQIGTLDYLRRRFYAGRSKKFMNCH